MTPAMSYRSLSTSGETCCRTRRNCWRGLWRCYAWAPTAGIGRLRLRCGAHGSQRLSRPLTPSRSVSTTRRAGRWSGSGRCSKPTASARKRCDALGCSRTGSADATTPCGAGKARAWRPRPATSCPRRHEVKTLSVICGRGSRRRQFLVYVGRPASSFHPLHFQAARLFAVHGVSLDRRTLDRVLELDVPSRTGGDAAVSADLVSVT